VGNDDEEEENTEVEGKCRRRAGEDEAWVEGTEYGDVEKEEGRRKRIHLLNNITITHYLYIKQ
jgi:hypothetical protein